MNDMILTLDDVSIVRSYNTVVRNASINIPENSIIGILGPNGAGKSSLVQAILNLIEYSGTIKYKGKNLKKLSTDKITELGISFVSSNNNIFYGFSIRENLKFAQMLARKRGKEHFSIEEILSLFPILEQRIDQSGSTLSVGEKQNVAIGMCLLSSPDLIILDEISSGLSPIAANMVFDSLKKINEKGVSIVLAEQDVNNVVRTVDSLYILSKGEISYQGTNLEAQRDFSNLISEYFGM